MVSFARARFAKFSNRFPFSSPINFGVNIIIIGSQSAFFADFETHLNLMDSPELSYYHVSTIGIIFFLTYLLIWSVIWISFSSISECSGVS